MFALRDEGVLDTKLTNDQITDKYTKAVGSGLLKTFSKMGYFNITVIFRRTNF